jgi:hypothetical protein
MPYRADGTVETTKPNSLNRQYRISRAIELRRAGLSWELVAQGAGFPSVQAAHNAVQRYLDKRAAETQQDVEVLRAQEVDRLDALQTSVWDKARDPGAEDQLEAVRTTLRLIRERSRLLGLERNSRALADAAGSIAGSLERDIAAQVVNVVLALADRLRYTPEQRVAAPAAIVAELEARNLIRPDSGRQLEARAG